MQTNSKLSSKIRLNGIVQKFNCCAGRNRFGRCGSTIPESANDPQMINVTKTSLLIRQMNDSLFLDIYSLAGVPVGASAFFSFPPKMQSLLWEAIV